MGVQRTDRGFLGTRTFVYPSAAPQRKLITGGVREGTLLAKNDDGYHSA